MTNGVMWILAFVVLFLMLMKYLKDKKQEDTVEDIAAPSAEEETPQETISVKDIVVETLKKIQCNPEVVEVEDKYYSIRFVYQAELIAITIDKDCRFITLYDVFWYSFGETDIKQLSNVKRIVNDINSMSLVNVYYLRDETEKSYHLHSSYSLVCVESEVFQRTLEEVLRDFFSVKRLFFRKLDQVLPPEEQGM